MKVALIQCPVWWTVDPPLGLAQVAGCLSHHGHEPVVFDLNVLLARSAPKGYANLWNWEQFDFWNRPEMVARFFKDNARLIEERVLSILRTDAPLIGFSVYSGSQLASLELARMIKKEDSSRKIVFGGQYLFLSANAGAILRQPAVDAVVRGPGDEVFPMMADQLADTGELKALPGVDIKEEGRVIDGGPVRPLRDLDAVPFADFSGLPIELYDVRVRLPIYGSRGCVWQCRFCSSHPFWKGYASMGGDRIFAEIMHHKRLYPWKTHFEFYDLTANGDVSSLERLAELAAEAVRSDRKSNFFGWKINAVIRPEMEPRLLGRLRDANCHDIIYGVESGSPRVRKLMNKPFANETARRVLRDTHEAGITTVANFMFGFPGETEEDFQMTLDFLKRSRRSLNRVYGSATFTSLEENSYLESRRKEFGVKDEASQPAHNLYWETEDLTNNYLVRLKRYERFRKLAIELGLDAYKGVGGSLEADGFFRMAQYHLYKNDRGKAAENFRAYLELDPNNKPVREELQRCRTAAR